MNPGKMIVHRKARALALAALLLSSVSGKAAPAAGSTEFRGKLHTEAGPPDRSALKVGDTVLAIEKPSKN